MQKDFGLQILEILPFGLSATASPVVWSITYQWKMSLSLHSLRKSYAIFSANDCAVKVEVFLCITVNISVYNA